MKKTIILSVLGLLTAYIGLSYYFSTLVITPKRINNTQVREHSMFYNGIDIMSFRLRLPEGTPFIIPSAVDATPLKGTLFSQDSSRCAVVITHGYNNAQLSMMKYAPIFWECGCDVLLYDHRGHGASGDAYATGAIYESQDLLTITEWLQTQTGLNRKYIAWMGESWGAATSLYAGASNEDVAFIIAESSFQDWETAVFERAQRMYGSWIKVLKQGVWAFVSWRTGVNAWDASIIDQCHQIAEPVLLFHSQSDDATTAIQSIHISEQLPPNQHRLHLLNWGAVHTNNVIQRPEEYRQLIFDFIDTFAPHWTPLRQCS